MVGVAIGVVGVARLTGVLVLVKDVVHATEGIVLRQAGVTRHRPSNTTQH